MGSVTLNGQDLMRLAYGSVVQLNQTVGDPVELVLEGRTIARGEVVLINGRNLGVRIVSLQK
jgi:flagellar motor switch protein FliN/FliY